MQDEVPKWLSNLEVPPVGASLLVKLAEKKNMFSFWQFITYSGQAQVVWRCPHGVLFVCLQKKQKIRAYRNSVSVSADFAVWAEKKSSKAEN